MSEKPVHLSNSSASKYLRWIIPSYKWAWEMSCNYRANLFAVCLASGKNTWAFWAACVYPVMQRLITPRSWCIRCNSVWHDRQFWANSILWRLRGDNHFSLVRQYSLHQTTSRQRCHHLFSAWFVDLSQDSVTRLASCCKSFTFTWTRANCWWMQVHLGEYSIFLKLNCFSYENGSKRCLKQTLFGLNSTTCVDFTNSTSVCSQRFWTVYLEPWMRGKQLEKFRARCKGASSGEKAFLLN